MKKLTDSYGNAPQGALPDNLPVESFHKKIDGLEFDVDFPEVRLREIDGAVIKWFNEDRPITVKFDNKQSYRVPAIWSTSDRFSMMNSDSHIKLRDQNGVLLLPIISVKRSQIELVPERTVAVDKGGASNFRLYVREYIDPTTMEKHYMTDSLHDNSINSALPIREIIEITAPKIVRLTYNVNCWSKKQRHSNEMLENIIVNFGQHGAVYANENMFFGAWITSISSDDNSENLNGDERIFNTSCDIIVESSIVLEESIRRYRTVEKVTFDIVNSEKVVSKNESDSIRELILWDSPYRLRR